MQDMRCNVMNMRCKSTPPPWRLLLAPVAVMAGCMLHGCSPASDEAANTVKQQERQVSVEVTPVTRMDFEERIIVQGTLEAQCFAMVPALIGGRIEEFYVDEGDVVAANETKLFQIDALVLTKALEISEQDLAVARCGLREKQANLERVQADFHKAELDYQRFQRLVTQEAVTQDAFENQESRYKQMKALLKHAHTLVDLGEEQQRQAAAAVIISEKNLRDTLSITTLNGVVSQRLYEPGEMAEMGKPVLRIEDPAVVEVSAFLPAEYYPRIAVGKTHMRVDVYAVDAGTHAISYKSPVIHPKLRTFEVKCVIEHPAQGVVPGAMAEIAVVLDQRKSLGILASAIQDRADKKIVFAVEGQTVKAVDVTLGYTMDGWIEILESTLTEGASVVTTGQYHINDGSQVSVLGEGA